jgi:hypothetical protein
VEYASPYSSSHLDSSAVCSARTGDAATATDKCNRKMLTHFLPNHDDEDLMNHSDTHRIMLIAITTV